MATTSQIRPFAFERVFVPTPQKKGAPDPLQLAAEAESLRAQIERMTLEQERALAHARQDGFDAGLAHARTEREAALLAAVDALQAGVEQLAEEADQLVAKVTGDGAELALAAADLMAARALAAAPADTVNEALGRALEQLGRNPTLQIAVHSSLKEEMERLVAIRVAGDRRKMFLDVVADDSLAPGDALLSWHEGGLRLDAAARRQAVMEELEGLLP